MATRLRRRCSERVGGARRNPGGSARFRVVGGVVVCLLCPCVSAAVPVVDYGLPAARGPQVPAHDSAPGCLKVAPGGCGRDKRPRSAAPAAPRTRRPRWPARPPAPPIRSRRPGRRGSRAGQAVPRPNRRYRPLGMDNTLSTELDCPNGRK
ncbi:hypothetical protein FS847_07955 [Streptomyces sp. ISID311]|nr:hypothetical protein FS847_07955 [Streptomyces sp. ISID311]